MNVEMIDSYAAGHQRLADALKGLASADLASRPPAGLQIGLWSIHQILVHLADTEAVLADRMKRVIAEENPTLLAFDENKWAQDLFYEAQSADDALQMIAIIRRQMVRVLKKLPPEAFERFGTHSAAGKKTLADLMQTADKHLNHHLAFIPKKRQWLGK